MAKFKGKNLFRPCRKWELFPPAAGECPFIEARGRRALAVQDICSVACVVLRLGNVDFSSYTEIL